MNLKCEYVSEGLTIRAELSSGIIDELESELFLAVLTSILEVDARHAPVSEPGSGVAPGEAESVGWSEPPAHTPEHGLVEVDHVVGPAAGSYLAPAGFFWSGTFAPDGSQIGDPMLVPSPGFSVPGVFPSSGVLPRDVLADVEAEVQEAHARDVWARTIGAPPASDTDGPRAQVFRDTDSSWPDTGGEFVPSWEQLDAAREERCLAQERARLEAIADDLTPTPDPVVPVADSGGSTDVGSEAYGSGAYKCEFCPPDKIRSFVTKQGLGVHRRRAHGAKWPVSASAPPVVEAVGDDGLIGCGVGDCTARRSPDKIAVHRLSLHGV